MSESDPPKKRTPTNPLRTEPVPGADGSGNNLQGIAPAVVEAFLNSNAKGKRDPNRGLFTAPLPALPDEKPVFNLRLPPNLGAFKAAADSEAIAQSRAKIRALVEATREATEVVPPPPPLTPPKPTGTAPLNGDLLQQHLAMRAKAKGESANPPVPLKPPGTGPLNAAEAMKLQHMALRAKSQPGPAGEETGRKMERMVNATLGAGSALYLRQSIEALEDSGFSERLTSLTDSVNRMVPGGEGVAKIGGDIGKQILMSNLNPVLALSMAAGESAKRFDTLKKWNDLSNKDRIANVAYLTGNLAEILGACTPPPVNFGAQVVGAGMSLVGLATENIETVEEVARATAGAESTRKVASGLNDAGTALAVQVKHAWDDLGERLDTLKNGKRKLPKFVETFLNSRSWKKIKKHPTSRNLAAGAENVIYNLATRWNAFTSRWDSTLDKLKGGKG